MKCPERILRFGICLLWVIPVYGMDSDPPNNRKVWIFFHEPHTRSVDSGPSRYLTRPTLGNRLMYISRNSAERSAAARFSDRLVSPSYIRKLEEMGVDCHVRSRWLNGVSAFLDESLMASVRQLPFVRSVQPVASYDFRPLPDIRMPRRNAAPVMDVLPYDYGPGLRQVEQIRVPEVHALGLDGSGVLIGIIDTGFESSVSIASRKHDLIAITIGDEREDVLSSSGVLALEDAETGDICYVDTSSRKLRRDYWRFMQDRREGLSRFFKRNGVDEISLKTGEPYENELVRFFKKRMRQFR